MASTKRRRSPPKTPSRRRTSAPERVLIPGTTIELVDPRMAALLEPIASIVPDPANPRTPRQRDALLALMRRYGFSDPIVVRRDGCSIEAGHQRYAVLLDAGATHVPVLWTHHGAIEAAGFNIGHNRASEVVAAWDDDALRRLLKTLRAEDEAATSELGWTDDELERLLGEYRVEEAPFPDLSTLVTQSDLKLRTFTLSQQQLATVERALAEAQTRGALWNPDENNANSNGNAIAAICALFLGMELGGG